MRRGRRENTTQTVKCVQDLKKDNRNNRSVLYNSYYILLYIDYLLFFTPSIISFIIVGIVWVGGNESGVFVKQRDEYMYRCDIFPPSLYPFYPLPHCHSYAQFFVRKACTHSSLLRSCPDVFFLYFFFCKTKTCNIITKLLSFSLPKSELLKTLKSNKNKKRNVTSTVG